MNNLPDYTSTCVCIYVDDLISYPIMIISIKSNWPLTSKITYNLSLTVVRNIFTFFNYFGSTKTKLNKVKLYRLTELFPTNIMAGADLPKSNILQLFGLIFFTTLSVLICHLCFSQLAIGLTLFPSARFYFMLILLMSHSLWYLT